MSSSSNNNNNNNISTNDGGSSSSFEDTLEELLSRTDFGSSTTEKPILFMDDDELRTYMESNEDLAALVNIDNEGTLEEVAENWKERGNQFFKRGTYKYPEAIACYTKAIQQNSSDLIAASIYHTNRAAVNLALGNYGMVIQDCKDALKANPANLKAYWRAAKAAVSLDKYKEAMSLCQQGLTVEPNNQSLQDELNKIQKKFQSKQQLEKKNFQEQKQKVEQRIQHYHKLEPEFDRRGILMGRPVYNMQNQYQADIYLDDDGALHWPVMLLYEEHNQSEFIKDFNETNCFADHLSYMFPSGTFADWDEERKYVLENLEIYFEAGCTTPIKPTDRTIKKRWIKVRQVTALSKVLSHPDYVIPGLPVFHIVVANSKFREAMLSREFD